jgi:hypothetical protein
MAARVLVGYCVRRAGDPPPPEGLVGVDGASVRTVEAAGLVVWLSAAGEGAPTLERVRDFDAVVRAALLTATPLPLRFGTRFASEEEARRALRERAEEFDGALGRVACRVEMGVRALWRAAPPRVAETDAGAVAAPPAAPRSGREYLELRRAEMVREEAERDRAAALLDRLAAHFPDLPAVRTPGAAPGVAGSVAHLVRIDELELYRSLFQSARADLVEADLVLTGPWAPYSFV